MKNHYQILLTSADISNLYDAKLLDNTDFKRLQRHPQLAQRSDWISSRFLKQQLAHGYTHLSLTHKKGYAALIACTKLCPIGIDMEYAQQRDFLALAKLCYTEIEQQWLSEQHNIATSFYQLWTLKEALIKADHGQLTDMRHWSLIPAAHQEIQIPVLPISIQAYTAIIDKNWYISVIFPEYFPPPQQCTHIFGHWSKHDIIWQHWPNQQYV